MTQIAFHPSSDPLTLSLELGSTLRLSDDELYDLCAGNPEVRIERTAEGDLIVMTPTGWSSGKRNLEIALALGAWAKRDGTGDAADSSTGFLLQDGAMRAPDAAWVLRARLDALSPEVKERFLPLCPDFVVELRSPSDALATLQAKMEEWVGNGARLAWLIDPLERTVHVYRPGAEPEVMDDPSAVCGDPELPGFSLDLAPIWAPV